MPQARDEAGNIWEVDAQGNPVRLVSPGGAQGGQNTVVAPNPARAAKEAAEAQRAAAADARATGADARAAAAAARADIEFWATHNPDGTPKKVRSFKPLPDSAAKRYEDAINAFANLDRAIGTFEDNFAGNTITGGIENTIQKRIDSFGTPGQAQWWSDIQTTDNALRNALFGASLTAGESKAWDQTTVNPSMDPLQVEENLRRRRDLAKGALSRRTNFLKANGYDPDAVSALAGEYGEELSAPAVKPSVWDQDSSETKRAASGESRNEYSADLSKRVDALINTGASKQEIDAMLNVNGFPPLRDDQWGPVQKWRQENPGKPYTGGNVNRSVANTALEQLSGSGLGAALAGATNMGSFGGVQALAPEQYAAISQANPGLTMGGEIAGALAGTQGLGAIGRGLTQRLAPKLLGGGSGAQFGRNLATDAAYGAGYGGVTEGDPLTGAAFAAGGSALGQGIGGATGRMLRGASPIPEAQTLASRGVEGLTVGQKLGGEWKAIEDRMANLPIVGTQVRNRMTEGFDSFNRAALNEAGAPIGATVTDTGERGLYQLLDNPETGSQGAIGRAYDAATAGVKVPLDPHFSADIASARAAGSALPPDYLPKFDKAMTNRIGPIEQAGEMTGDQFQQAMRGLKGYRSGAAGSAPGFEIDWKAALSQAQNALRSQMQRGGGKDVVSGLGNADEAYRLAKTIQSAQSAAKGGSSTGELRIFSPSQLLNASEKTAAKYPGPRPFAELADAAQTALPSKIPDSGSAGRIAQVALGGTAIGGAGGGFAGGYEGATAGGVGGAATPLAILGLLALGASKKGQKGFEKLLFERSGPLSKYAGSAGRGLAVGQKKGLFGAPTLPFLLEAYNQ